jgi:hypothetical protein
VTAEDKGQIMQRARDTCVLSTRGLESNVTSTEFSVIRIRIVENKNLILFTILNAINYIIIIITLFFSIL